MNQSEQPIPSAESAALRKATLIQEALETLRAGHQIDERDDLTAASFLEWYDRTIPGVRDIKILAGAMEIELARRRGERIIQEGDFREGRTNVSKLLTSPLSSNERRQRSEDRVLAATPEAVQAFVTREVSAGRVPSMHRAIGVARTARATAAPHRHSKQVESQNIRTAETDEHILTAITTVADGKRRTEAQLATVTGYDAIPSFLSRIRLIPWLTIDRTPEGLQFQIDDDLRAICEGRRPRPTLSYASLDQFLRELRETITRKRKENHDDRHNPRWRSELIIRRQQSDLLDWIEEQLDRVLRISE